MMRGNLDMGGCEITNLTRVLTTNNSAVTKKWVTNEFPTKREILDGFMLSGPLDLNDNKVYGLPDVPTTENSVTSKKYTDNEVGKITLSGGTMTDDINMGGNDISHLPDVPPTDNSATSKKYVDSKIMQPGLSQVQADNRYVRKTKLTLGEWMVEYNDKLCGIQLVIQR